MQIAIASGKGGTGKTTLAVNLAVLLSEKFSGTGQKVLLADLDVEEPNSGLFLKGDLIEEQVNYRMVPDWKEDKCTLCKRCANVCEFNALAFLGISVMIFPELCHSCYACSDLCPEDALPMEKRRMGVTRRYRLNESLEFMESRIDIGVEQATPLIEQTRKYIKENYDDQWMVLLDSPPGTSCPVMEAVKDADLVLLITEPTPFGFHDLKLAMDTMGELGKKYAVVINKYGIGNDEVLHYCEQKQIPVIGKLPHLTEAAVLYSKGKNMVDTLPAIRNEIEKIYSGILKLTEDRA
ncbi:ATP-binding protein [Candidatus Sulfidibacterium hydrothermale]|jgi:MinD superfamily P-loop ATPase|uniref:ATP-binding protein n=1 Tax=Candidatus Sulfidibacterium hydrothermale TaxID=2875962 RepID=UPI001F0A9BDB|nr:ATP-binding protein [Candidatus Sulfidibacterium hydrothermale]UBM61914.1 ATP-binding protein [Candidatus Sulfidibacterium hydrothermale]